MIPRKKILVLGATLRNYPRNRVVLEALEQFCELEEVKTPETMRGQVLFVYTLLTRSLRADGIFLTWPTSYFAFTIYIFSLLARCPIIGDPFISTYDTLVSDRALARGKSLKGLYYHLRDVLYVNACDVLMFDTPEHEAYFLRNCRIPKDTRRLVVPICVNTEKVDRIAAPSVSAGEQRITVLFLGGYIPLQGIQYIIEAAACFRDRPNIRFVFIGNGQTKRSMVEKASNLSLDNVQFVDALPHEEVLSALKGADVALGIFGNTEKAQRVIPNKVLESMTAGIPVVSGRSVPMERYFQDDKHIFYARLADPKDIARAIDRVLADPTRARIISRAARELIQEHFSDHAMRDTYIPALLAATFGNKSAEITKKTHKVVVYTAIFGPKDLLRDPMVKPPHCDFVCFTDQPLHSNVWEIRKVSPPVVGDPVRSNRNYKFFAHRYLSEYPYSIYVDGNMRLLADPMPLIEMYLRDSHIAFFDHMGNIGDARDCVYDEAEALIQMHKQGKSKELPEIIKKQVEAYRNDGYPAHNGLITAMVIIRRHNEPEVIRLMSAWWDELKIWSKRDQLSFNYVAWKLRITYALIPGDSRNGPYFYRHGHARSGLMGRLRAWVNERLFEIGFC